jgi:hypothetical protein
MGRTNCSYKKLKILNNDQYKVQKPTQHYEESTLQAHQRPPTTPQNAGGKEHIASLEAQVACLVQQNEELHLHL